MPNKYRVAMTDKVDGKDFTFAVHYQAANANQAGIAAMKEWDNLRITEIKRVEV